MPRNKSKSQKFKDIEMPLKMNWGTQKLEPDLEELRKQNPEIKVKEMHPKKIFNKKYVIWLIVIYLLILIITWTLYLFLS